MNQIHNIVLTGVGGQGILLAAKVIAAAAMEHGAPVAANEIHGMAQRGGSVIAQVRFGEGLRSPLILEGSADVLFSLEAGEAIRYAHYLKPDGVALVSAQQVIPVTVTTGAAKYPDNIQERLASIFPRLWFRDFPAAAAELGNPKLSNTLMLGLLAAVLPAIPDDCWLAALKRCVKPELYELNRRAFAAGKEMLA